MPINHRFAKYLNLACLMLIAAGLSACSRTISFEEEVEIANGRKVVIKRSTQFERSCEGFSCGWRLSQSSIRSSDVPISEWAEKMWPMVLVVSNTGDLVLIALRPMCEGPRYRQYVSKNNKWNEMPLDKAYFDTTANLLMSVGEEHVKLPIRVEAVYRIKENNAPGFPGYVRTVSPQIRDNC